MKKNGFTLVELLIVVTIVMLLIGIMMPVISRIRNQGRRVEAQGLINSLAQSLQNYQSDVGDFPDEWDDGPDGDLGGGNDSGGTFAWYLLNKGISPPYIEVEKYKIYPIGLSKAEMIKEKNLRLLDPWPFEERKEEDGNWFHYYRAPHLGSPAQPGRRYESPDELNQAQKKFKGNKNSYNLWSFGGNQKDDSSDTTDSAFKDGDPPKYRHPGGDDGPDPDSDEGIKDDVVNWIKK